MKVFIDTSAFCALTVPKDQNNHKAKALHQQMQSEKPSLYTSDYVLDEVYTLLKTRSCHDTSIKFMDRINNSNTIVLRITDDIIEAAKAIFRRFEDKKMSFTDCTSFALINHTGIEAVFAFDNHFRYPPYSHPVQFLE